MLRSSPSGEPLCFDGMEGEVAAHIVELQARLVSKRGFNPGRSAEQRAEAEGRVESVVASAFCTVFGLSPEDRYTDVCEQVADFASHLAKGHIFPDANKRTTVAASVCMLHIAGLVPDVDDGADPESNALYLWIQGVVTGEKEARELAAALREYCAAEPCGGIA